MDLVPLETLVVEVFFLVLSNESSKSMSSTKSSTYKSKSLAKTLTCLRTNLVWKTKTPIGRNTCIPGNFHHIHCLPVCFPYRAALLQVVKLLRYCHMRFLQNGNLGKKTSMELLPHVNPCNKQLQKLSPCHSKYPTFHCRCSY